MVTVQKGNTQKANNPTATLKEYDWNTADHRNAVNTTSLVCCSVQAVTLYDLLRQLALTVRYPRLVLVSSVEKYDMVTLLLTAVNGHGLLNIHYTWDVLWENAPLQPVWCQSQDRVCVCVCVCVCECVCE